jgi:hypothetical protein
MSSGINSAAQLSGPLAMAGTTRDLAAAYDASSGAFRPAPPIPKARKNALSARRLQQAAAEVRREGQVWVGGEGGGRQADVGLRRRSPTNQRLVVRVEGLTPCRLASLRALLLRRLAQAAVAPEMRQLLRRAEAADSEDAAEDALRHHWRVLRKFSCNQELRREKALTLEKLKRFKAHLAAKHSGK